MPDFEVPYHVDIMEKLNGIDIDAARRTSGNGFYYLKGDIARLHSACLSYARDFMIDRGFTYYIPPYMIRSSVVTGVMSFAEMEMCIRDRKNIVRLLIASVCITMVLYIVFSGMLSVNLPRGTVGFLRNFALWLESVVGAVKNIF